MTSRERVLSALNHVEPDRVPLDIAGHRSSGVSAMLYPKLRAALGLPARTVRVRDMVQQIAVVDNDVLDALGVDTVELGQGFCQDASWWVDWTLPDGTPCQIPNWTVPERLGKDWVFRNSGGHVMARMPEGAFYFDATYWPFLDGPEELGRIRELFPEHMWTSIASFPGPAGANPADLRAGAQKLRASSDRAILAQFGGNLLEMGQFHYRMDGFLMLLGEDPARAHRFLDALMEIHFANLEAYLGAVGDSIDVIVFGDDLGAQNGPQISPRMYKEFFQPRHAALWKRAKELAPVKVMLHCCGGVRPLLPLLIEAGLDAINPVQTSCRGMDPADLKRDFGRDLTFWGGGCDTRDMLPNGTAEEVRAHVDQRCRIWAPGGGYVFQQVHNILANIPVENVLAMCQAVRASGAH
jgi:uroporphyrinogen decarboxylase